MLNLGSGGMTYDLPPSTFELDLSIAALKGRPRAAVGDAHLLPVQPSSIDVCVCVGSVANYVSLVDLFSEVNRSLKLGGVFILEYERSEPYGRSKVHPPDLLPLRVPYRGEEHTCWFYSERYLEGALLAAGFAIEARREFHIGSQFLARFHIPLGAAALAGFADRFLARLGAGLGANAALRCTKGS